VEKFHFDFWIDVKIKEKFRIKSSETLFRASFAAIESIVEKEFWEY